MSYDILPALPVIHDAEIQHIVSFPGYAITAYGDVWSYHGPRGLRASWLSLKLLPTRDGYLRVALCRDGHVCYKFVHRVVLEAFVGPCPYGYECCHANGIRSDNRLENLRWDTRRNNHADKKRHGTHQGGAQHPMAKLTKYDVQEIRRLFQQGWSVNKILSLYGPLSDTHVYRIIHNKSWKS